MDVQMPVTPPAASASGGAQAGKTNTADAASTVQDAGTAPAFTKVLQGQMQSGNSDTTDASDPALTLAGLLQMLQALTMPMQQATASDASQGDDQALPELLLQAMNSTPGLADKLLQDPAMQQWFAQAQELLAAMMGASSNPASTNVVTPNAASNASPVLQAQQTLLTLTSLLKQQPDNPVLQYLSQQLQQAVQPLAPELANSFAQVLNAAGAQQQVVEDDVDTDAVAQIKPHEEQAKGTNVHAAGRHAAAKHAAAANQEQAVVVEDAAAPSAKAQLETLAARNGISSAAVSDKPSQADATQATAPEVATADSVSVPNATVVVEAPKTVSVHEMMKTPPQPIQASQFTQDMTQYVLKSMKITLTEGISEAKLSLFPKNLGHVDVKITMHEGQLIAQFAADTLAGKQMLESQLPQLRQALQSQGLQVEKLEVTQSQNMQSGMFQDQRHQQSSGQTFRQNKSRSGNYEQDADFVQEIASAAAEARTTVYGNSFDVTA
ncbi:flagellar hook-length control protein FliK [Paenibacillus athensensis]|uniref:Flagellar hook-length control protein-like C-terminal domain-containing protein n=1 Tax=Paenibacillus athensensis TaxID=1967502 RepID=A0A4Y8Q9U2_9BACL|nr:flagellar hook-length control protein FliK [Paenibacillus athensensis]MCD1257817.1 flagellar hook-length control protein FliK [Paenibacillus athensensis]